MEKKPTKDGGKHELPKDLRKALQDYARSDDIIAAQEVLTEVGELYSHIAEVLKSDTYDETIEDILEKYSLRELAQARHDPSSDFYAIMESANVRARLENGRKDRKAIKENAISKNAIMELKGGYPFFSDSEYSDAFTNSRICKMGEMMGEEDLDASGKVTRSINDGDIIELAAADVSIQAFMLLNAVLANSVENVRENFIQDGKITFYVSGVLKKVTSDPRTLRDMQLDINRKTAGVIYLESLFKPLQGYVGLIDGSRYAVLNYVGYDADSDTMSIQSPYLYQIWRAKQGAYLDRVKDKKHAITDGKKPKKRDYTPLEINQFFHSRAIMADPIIIEIAVYITNVILNAGVSSNKTEIKYRTIIKECPRFRDRLEEIENNDALKNKTARYNKELTKIKRAFDLISDKTKCSFLDYYEITKLEPSKTTDGKSEFSPPTKRMVNDGKLVIRWKYLKKSEENDG